MNKLTPSQRDVIDTLARLQKDLDKSDVDFARDHLKFSSTRWCRIKSGEYFDVVKDTDAVLLPLKMALQNLRQELAMKDKFAELKFISFTHFEAIFQGVKVCKVKKNENRLNVYLAETGGGKTALCGRLREEFDADIVEAKESWRKSYFAAMCDIAEVIGANTEHVRFERAMERLVIERLRLHRRILVIDEGEYFGPRTLNLLKMILNKTPTVIVLCAIPQAYHNWNTKFRHEAQQLRRRTHALIRCLKIAPSDAEKFLAHLHFASDAKAACTLLANAANGFGHYDLITRVADSLRHEKNVTLEDIEKSITEVQALIGMEAKEAA